MAGLNAFDYGIISVYLLVMVLIGFLLAKANKNDQDYFKGGSKIPWPLSSLSLFIGAFSAYMFVAASGQAYKCGIPSLLLYTSAFYPFMLAAIFWGRLWRRARITSPMEYVEMRFGPATKSLFTFIQVPFAIIGSGNSLYCLCIFMSSALGLTSTYSLLGMQLNGLQIAMILTGVIILVYTAAGGLWAVVVTDTVQFIIVMVVSLTVAIASIFFISGSGAGIEAVLKNPPNPGYFKLVNNEQPLFFTIAYISLTLFSNPGSFSLIQRSSCVSDESAASKTSGFASIFFLIAPIIWLLPIFIMRTSLPDLGRLWPQLKNPTEATYLTIAMMLLPHGMIGLAVSAILAATLSSLSVNYNIMALIATHDIYKQYFNPKANPRHLMIAGKVLTVMFGICAILMGLLLAGYKDAFNTTLLIASHTVLSTAFPLVLGILIRRVPWWIGIVSLLVCMGCTLSIDLFVPWAARFTGFGLLRHIGNHPFEYKVFTAIYVNLAVFGLGYLHYNKSNDSAGAEELFGRFKRPISQDTEHGDVVVPNLKAYRLVAYSLAVFGTPLILFSLFFSERDPKRIDLVVGTCLIMMCGILCWITSMHSPFGSVQRQIEGQKMKSEVGEIVTK
jgi:SSS family solute:Na+ symporter